MNFSLQDKVDKLTGNEDNYSINGMVDLGVFKKNYPSKSLSTYFSLYQHHITISIFQTIWVPIILMKM